MVKHYQKYIEDIETALKKLKLPEKPTVLYEPVKYTMAKGGKRLRPALALMAANVFSSQYKKAMPFAVGIELLHNFTLIHDDIMDESPIRRGKPTVFKKWDTNVALLSGDVTFALAMKQFSLLPKLKLSDVLSLITQTTIHICEGQQFDMDFEKQSMVSLEDYLKMIRLKTAVLLGASLQGGAIIGGADKENAFLLNEIGVNLGMAFQLKDDWLDLYGTQNVFGKKIGNDIISGKKSFLYIFACERADSTDRSKLTSLYEDKLIPEPEKVAQVKNIYDIYQVKSNTLQYSKEYYDKALKYLGQLNVADIKKEPLLEVIEILSDRKN